MLNPFKTREAILNLVHQSLVDGVISPEELYQVQKSYYQAVGSDISWQFQPRKRQKTSHPAIRSGPVPMRRGRNGEERYQGQLQQYNTKSGYGFIKCETLPEKYKSNDVFLHKNQYEECVAMANMTIDAGQWVEFSIHDKDGKPQARDVVPMF